MCISVSPYSRQGWQFETLIVLVEPLASELALTSSVEFVVVSLGLGCPQRRLPKADILLPNLDSTRDTDSLEQTPCLYCIGRNSLPSAAVRRFTASPQ